MCSFTKKAEASVGLRPPGPLPVLRLWTPLGDTLGDFVPQTLDRGSAAGVPRPPVFFYVIVPPIIL